MTCKVPEKYINGWGFSESNVHAINAFGIVKCKLGRVHKYIFINYPLTSYRLEQPSKITVVK